MQIINRIDRFYFMIISILSACFWPDKMLNRVIVPEDESPMEDFGLIRFLLLPFRASLRETDSVPDGYGDFATSDNAMGLGWIMGVNTEIHYTLHK